MGEWRKNAEAFPDAVSLTLKRIKSSCRTVFFKLCGAFWGTKIPLLFEQKGDEQSRTLCQALIRLGGSNYFLFLAIA